MRRGQVRDLHVHWHSRPRLWHLQRRVLLPGLAQSTDPLHDVRSRSVSEDRVPCYGQSRVQYVLARVHVPLCGTDGRAGVHFGNIRAWRWDVYVSDVLSAELRPWDLPGALQLDRRHAVPRVPDGELLLQRLDHHHPLHSHVCERHV
jgi:hypothetical protein